MPGRHPLAGQESLIMLQKAENDKVLTWMGLFSKECGP